MSEWKVAIVTGAAQGLGAAITRALLKKGYKVCVADILEEKGNQFVKEQQKIFGTENVIFSVCDVSKETDYKKTFDLAVKEFGRIDVVVNNAGVLNESQVRKTIDVNLLGPIIGCQLAFKYMGKSNGGRGGMVINTSSIAGLVPCHATPVYTATKHGVIGLTRSFGLDFHLKRDGILFAALCLCLTDTAIAIDCCTNSLDPDFNPYKLMEAMTPDYVAGGAMKLLEDKINGSTLLVSKDQGYQYIGYHEELMKHIIP